MFRQEELEELEEASYGGWATRRGIWKRAFPQLWKTKQLVTLDKSLGGLPAMKETRAGKRNKRKMFCKDSPIRHELPVFKE